MHVLKQMKDKITTLIFEAIDEYNLSQVLENRLEKKIEEVLFARSGYTEKGKLDSMNLVYFLVIAEQHLQKHFGNNSVLKIQEVIEKKESSLKNIGTFINYIETNLKSV